MSSLSPEQAFALLFTQEATPAPEAEAAPSRR